MEEQDIKLPEPIHVKNIHHKLDIFSENNIIKEWGGYAIVDTFFYLYLFNKYKHNCLLKYNSLTNTSLGLELQIKEKKHISSEEREEFIEWVIKCYGELFQGGVFLSLIN